MNYTKIEEFKVLTKPEAKAKYKEAFRLFRRTEKIEFFKTSLIAGLGGGLGALVGCSIRFSSDVDWLTGFVILLICAGIGGGVGGHFSQKQLVRKMKPYFAKVCGQTVVGE